MLSQWSYILTLEERPKGEEAEKRGNLSPLEIRNDGRMLDLIHIFGKAGALHKLTFTPFRECSQYFHIHLLHTKLFTFTQITFFLRKCPTTYIFKRKFHSRKARSTNEQATRVFVGYQDRQSISWEESDSSARSTGRIDCQAQKGIGSAIEIKLTTTLSQEDNTSGVTMNSRLSLHGTLTCQYRAALPRIEQRCFYLCCWVVRPLFLIRRPW